MLPSPSHLLHSGVPSADKKRVLYQKYVMGKRREEWNPKREEGGEFQTLSTSLLQRAHSSQSCEETFASCCSCSVLTAVNYRGAMAGNSNSSDANCLLTWFSIAYVNLPFYEWRQLLHPGQEIKRNTFQDTMAEVQTHLTVEGSNIISLSGPLIKPWKEIIRL